MIDFSKIQLSATTSSLKIYQEGSGTLVLPPGNTTPGGDEVSEGTLTIPHNYGSTDLLWQVIYGDVEGLTWTTPFSAANIDIFSHIDENNLYVTIRRYAPGTEDGFSTPISYRIFIP